MVQHDPKACQFCGEQFIPHQKVGPRQIACQKAECRRARKRENLQKLYRSDPGYNYDNVKRYRTNHPDYQRRWRQKRKEKLKTLDPARLDAGQARKTACAGRQQQIAASLFVSPEAAEIQTELSPVKTDIATKRNRALREIQTELTLYFSVQLSKLLDVLPEARYKPS
jgi:hypothetical protein